ncbi:LysR family transcriptional regulator [Bradyrhizobium guangzhouense]|uniref:LysR family transcriptional regulator n=1 Tax=Bradyrhizobium guangzhouense TaxID=1325095 RepID=UPI0013E8CF54|nr:LysR family transcriptional regulator [Bradyrhizobium guangzhouense]
MHLSSWYRCNGCIEMDLRQLRTFVVVAEAGGFAAAQQHLHLSQPAASRQIQALEAELGIPLFDRVGRGIKLTSEGEDLLRRGRRLLQDAESFGERARALRTGKAGALRVGCSTQHIETVLANFLPMFRRKHPSVVIELIEDGGARVPDRLQRGDVHLAIIPAADDGYHRRLLAPVHMLAAVSPRHSLASRRKLEIAELADESLLLLRRDFASRGWFDAACNVAHIRPRVTLESAAPHTLLALAKGGNDVAIVPSNVQIPSTGVRAFPLIHRGASIGRWTAVAWDPQRFLAPYAESFIEALVAYCGRHYPGRQFARRVSPLPKPEQTKV